jgi:hypothetical protein
MGRGKSLDFQCPPQRLSFEGEVGALELGPVGFPDKLGVEVAWPSRGRMVGYR